MRGSLTRIAPLLAALAAALPATAAADPAPTGGAPAPVPAPAVAPTPASPFALSGGGTALLGAKVRLRGQVARRLARRTVRVQVLDPVTQAWTALARTTVNR